MIKKYSALALISFLVFSCGEDDLLPEGPGIELSESRLVSAEKQVTRLAGDLQGLYNLSGLELPFDEVQYDVQVWKIEYETTYGDQTVVASGMVFLPESDEPSPFASYHHGTIADDDAAPTNSPSNSTEKTFLAILAGTGFNIVAPDYIGFGSSTDLVHPYYVEQPMRDAILDNLLAAAELLNEEEMEASSRLYLLGYSEGGYATMAAHKGIEEQGIEFFDLQASFPASGGYDIIGVRDYFFSLETYNEPFFMAFVAEAYRNYYGWDDDVLGLLFQEPYASAIPDYFDGSMSGGAINNKLTTTIPDLINPEILASPDDEQFSILNDRLDENSLDQWLPTIPVYMYHGDADITVPFQNSVDVFENFQAMGVAGEVVSFTVLEGSAHGSGAFPWLLDVVERIFELEGK